MGQRSSPALSAEGKKVYRQFCLAELFYGCVWGTMSFITLLLSTSGLNSQQVGLTMSITSVFAMISAPFWGVIADKLGSRKKLFLFLMVSSGLGFALLPWSTTIKLGGLSLVMFLLPAATFVRQPGSSVMDAMVVGTTTHFPGMSYSSIRLWNSIGYTIISPLYTMTVNAWGVAFPFYMFLVFSAITGLLTYRIKEYDTRKAKEDEMEAAAQPAPKKEKLQWGKLFKNYYLVTFLIFNIVVFLPSQMYWFLNYLLPEVGGDASAVGTLAGIRTIFEVLGLFIMPFLKKRFSLPQLILISGTVYAGEMLLYPVCSSAMMVTVVQCLDGLGFGLLLGAAPDYVYALAPEGLKTTATTLYGAGMGAAGIIGNAFAGWAIAAVGIKMTYLFSGLCVVAFLAFFVLTFVFGRMMKKPAPVPFFRKKEQPAA